MQFFEKAHEARNKQTEKFTQRNFNNAQILSCYSSYYLRPICWKFSCTPTNNYRKNPEVLNLFEHMLALARETDLAAIESDNSLDPSQTH